MRVRRVKELSREIVHFEGILVLESKVQSVNLIGRRQPEGTSGGSQDFRCTARSDALDLSERYLVLCPRISDQELKVFCSSDQRNIREVCGEPTGESLGSHFPHDGDWKIAQLIRAKQERQLVGVAGKVVELLVVLRSQLLFHGDQIGRERKATRCNDAVPLDVLCECRPSDRKLPSSMAPVL